MRLYDVGTIREFERTPTGGLRLVGRPTRSGVFVYKTPSGPVRMYRPPEEVFHHESTCTLRGAAMTVGHPAEFVTPENWQTLAVGTLTDTYGQEAQWLVAGCDVNRADAVARIEAGELCELSCGYDAHIEYTPGTTPEGEAYDAVQSKIRYNHVALLEAGRARAGSGASLILDGEMMAETENDPPKEGEKPADPATAMKELEDALAATKAELDACKKQLDAVRGALSGAEAKCDALEKSIPERVRRRIAAEKSAAVYGVAVSDAMSDDDLAKATSAAMRAKAEALGVKVTDESDDFIRGALSAVQGDPIAKALAAKVSDEAPKPSPRDEYVARRNQDAFRQNAGGANQ